MRGESGCGSENASEEEEEEEELQDVVEGRNSGSRDFRACK